MMGDLGFLAFRTEAEVPGTDSCLLVMIRDAPTRRHYDPDAVGYWTMVDGQGRWELADRDTAAPKTQRFSWGRIRLEDRYGARNDFVTFGGWLATDRVADDALLLVFRSPAPILRLGGHSQPGDHLAEEVLVFFSHLVPRLWDGRTTELMVGSEPPEHLWAAFLLHVQKRVRSSGLREALAGDAVTLGHELDREHHLRPEAIDEGRRLLARLGL